MKVEEAEKDIYLFIYFRLLQAVKNRAWKTYDLKTNQNHSTGFVPIIRRFHFVEQMIEVYMPLEWLFKSFTR